MKLTPVPGVLPTDIKDAPRSAGKPGATSFADELDKYLKMTPEQRVRDAILKKLGLTEGDLAAMPPAERQAIEEKIAALTKEMMADAQSRGQQSRGQFRQSDM